MKIILQRVLHANLKIKNKTIAEINRGLVVFIGITSSDTISDIPRLADKILKLRIFNDKSNKMNIS